MLLQLQIFPQPPRSQGRAVLPKVGRERVGVQEGLQFSTHLGLASAQFGPGGAQECELVISCTLWLRMSTHLTVCAAAVV